MLFRVFFRLIEAKSYIHHYVFLLNAKNSHSEDDYRKFLEYSFINFIFNPLVKIITFIYFCLNILNFISSILLTATYIVCRFCFIKIPTNIIFYFLKNNYKLTYLFIEFVFMFVSSYVFSFKIPIKLIFIEIKEFFYDFFGYPEGYNGSFAMEIYPDEYQEYLNSFENNSAPDLNVYYPMRYALSSVMIRLTGVILSILFLFILFFNFTNLFIIGDANFSELRKSVDYKMMEFMENYKFWYNKYYISSNYDTETFLSTIKCLIIIIYANIKLCFKYLVIDAYVRFEFSVVFKIKYYILKFFYNFFIYIFLFVFPIHFYYVVYHSYRIFSISKNLGDLFLFIYKITLLSLKVLYRVLKKFWQVLYDIMTVEEPDVHAIKNKNKEKK